MPAQQLQLQLRQSLLLSSSIPAALLIQHSSCLLPARARAMLLLLLAPLLPLLKVLVQHQTEARSLYLTSRLQTQQQQQRRQHRQQQQLLISKLHRQR